MTTFWTWKFNDFSLFLTSYKWRSDAFSDLYVRCVHCATKNIRRTAFSNNMDLHMAKLRNCMRLWIIVHKVDMPAGTSWPLLARCPARGSILASDHLPSNPLVFAFWVVANGRFELQFWGKVIGTVIECSCSYKTMWPSPFSRPLPSPYTMLKLGKNSGSMRPNLFMGLVGGGGGGDGYALSKVLSSGFRSNFCIQFVGRDVCRMRVNWPHCVARLHWSSQKAGSLILIEERFITRS